VSSMGRGLFACLVLLRMQEYSRADTSVDVTSANQQAESTAIPAANAPISQAQPGFWYRVITSDVGSVAPR
jgi:DNA-binding beta-propeller fold protein YncE